MSRGISVRLQDETWKRVDKLRIEVNKPMSRVVEALIREGLNLMDEQERLYAIEQAGKARKSVVERSGSAGVLTVEEQKRPMNGGLYERCEHGRNGYLCLMLACRKARETVIRVDGVIHSQDEQINGGAVSG